MIYRDKEKPLTLFGKYVRHTDKNLYGSQFKLTKFWFLDEGQIH